MTLFRCSVCAIAVLLVVTVGEQWLCATCWTAAGKPWPRYEASAEEADRHKVIAGKT